MKNKFDFKGKTVLITGASGEIGREIARQYYDAGAYVVLSGTNEVKLDALSKLFAGRSDTRTCNLHNQELCNNLINTVPNIDILVCNAGITKDMLSIRMKNKDFSDVLNVNLTASFILNREAIKKMLKRKSGRIINISSVVGQTGNSGQVNYAASKAGLIGMTKSFAQEVASKNITVNAIAPGFIESDMTNKLTDMQKEHIMTKIPMKFFGQPCDVANACLFLSMDASRYITGQVINVNGGMFM